MKKNISLRFIIIFLILFVIVGCGKEQSEIDSPKPVNNESIETKKEQFGNIKTGEAKNSLPCNDVSKDCWAYDSIVYLARSGWNISDLCYGDGTFRGDRYATRYEMAQMIAMLLEKTDKFKPLSRKIGFKDVPNKHWAYTTVASLGELGVLAGYSDGTFRGDNYATRYEMVYNLAKAIVSSSKKIKARNHGKPFTDFPNKDFWAYDSLVYLTDRVITSSYADGTFRGDNYIKRYEAIDMISRAFMAMNSQ